VESPVTATSVKGRSDRSVFISLSSHYPVVILPPLPLTNVPECVKSRLCWCSVQWVNGGACMFVLSFCAGSSV